MNEALLNKDREIREIAQQAKQAQRSVQIYMAKNAENESAIEELKGVIQQKDETVADLHNQMAKLMERLSDAEQKLFELQDVFTEDGQSQRNSSVYDTSFVDRWDRRNNVLIRNSGFGKFKVYKVEIEIDIIFK